MQWLICIDLEQAVATGIKSDSPFGMLWLVEQVGFIPGIPGKRFGLEAGKGSFFRCSFPDFQITLRYPNALT